MSEEHVTDIDAIMEKASRAAAVFSQLDQRQTDRIVHAVYEAGFNNRVRLARMAFEETGLGRWEDKVLKNVVATQLVYENIKDLKTAGIVSEDHDRGIIEIAQPIGPIFAVIPVTNPTSTTLFKILIALKTRNPVIIHPHHKAVKCSVEAARLCYEAALGQDAPEDCVQWAADMSREQTQALMGHRRLALVLATGGSSMVRAAYSSGTPALGVGSGNVPVFIERSADVPFAVEQIFISKAFDNGTICASEQAVVVERCVVDEAASEFTRRGARFLSDEETERLGAVVYDRARNVMNLAVVGQPAPVLCRMARIEAPADVSMLIAPLKGVGDAYPLSSEILAPILAWYVADDFSHAVNLCIDLNFHGGIGHTASIFSNDDEKIAQFAGLMNAGRIVVNTPSSQGAVGGMYNTLDPSFTLGCGSGGKNITTDNITARHLLNIQRIARRRVNARWERMDKERYLDEAFDAKTAESEYNRNY